MPDRLVSDTPSPRGPAGEPFEPRTTLQQSLAFLIPLGLLAWAIHIPFLTQYGIFRDELYYLACARQLAWGYVDHPPLSIAVLATMTGLLGDALPVVRFLPGLCAAVLLIVTGLLARRLGAGRFGQALAGVAIITSPAILYTTHVFSMNAFDYVFWALASLLLLRALDGERTGSWIALGVVLGLGFLNKISLLWWVGGAVVGLLFSGPRRVILSRGPWIALALAALIFAPHVIWQVSHGWPTLEFMRNATSEKMVALSPLKFLLDQILVMNPATAPLWLAGLVFLLFARRAESGRLLAVLYLAVLVLLVSGGRSRASYLGPAYAPLFAAGAAWFERWIGRGPRALALAAGALAVAFVLLGGAVGAPLGLPMLSPEKLAQHAKALGLSGTEERVEEPPIPQHMADMFGWEDLARRVARVYRALPPDEQKGCAIFGQNYGEAGAIDYFGRRLGLPRAISNHNNYWLWGPRGADGSVVIEIGGTSEDHLENFRSATPADTTSCTWCMPYENGRTIWVLRGLKRPIAEVWPSIRMFI